MTDSLKTIVFAAVALVCAAVAIFVSIPPPDVSIPELVDKPLFAEFENPGDAARLEIIKVNEDIGQLTRFEVERSPSGRWTIPSHGNYPADATEQMRDAATSLLGLTVIEVMSQDASSHETYGVVEPSESRLEAGGKGFGMVVGFKDRQGKELARLVIGQAVRDRPELRFVRKAGQDPVYVVELNVDKLSTKFSDWIEKDLLKLSPWDIDQVTIKDYQFLPQQSPDGRFQVAYDPRLELKVGWDQDTNAWVLDSLTQYQRGRPISSELKPDEELNKDKLDQLKTALDSLQIVDVQAKPKGLGGDLSVEEAALENEELATSLQRLGFLPLPRGRKIEFLGTNGEVNVRLKDGVEYVLRFGNSAGSEEGDETGKQKRYLLVFARLDESRLKPPALEPLPEGPAENEPAAEPPAEETPADDEAADEADADEASFEEEEAADAEEAAADAPAAADEPAADEPAAGEEAKPSEFDLQRKRIEQANERKLNEYKDRRRKAEGKVRELNARFAGWYYIISDEEFRKIHLSRADVIQEKTGTGEEGFGPDALRDLQEQGIEKPAATPPGQPEFSFPM